MTNTMATNETSNLISADKVEGTAVFNAEGEKLGTVENLMLDKRGGKVAYAVMSFGGFLGMGEKNHPLPWDTLKYDDNRDGYVVNLTKEQLKDAPTIDRNDGKQLHDRAYGDSVHKYYGVSSQR